jgi:hypothetical protein
VRIAPLLLAAISIAAAGFLPFWLSRVPALNIAGLFVAGLGIANVFPLTLSAASSSVLRHQTDAASSRITLAAGCAILITPQALGSFADQTSIQTAYVIPGLFLALAAGAVVWAAHYDRVHHPASNPEPSSGPYREVHRRP